MMQNIYDIPNKYVFAFYYIGALPFLAWIAFGGKLLSILTGICMLIMGLISIIRPDLLPRSRLMYSADITANTFIISQRIIGFAIILLAIYISYIGKIGSTLDIGVMAILLFGALLIIYLIYRKRHHAESHPSVNSQVKFGIAGCVAFVVLGILLIIINAPMNIRGGFSLLIGTLAGGFLGLLLLNRKSKKFLKKANSNNSESQAI